MGAADASGSVWRGGATWVGQSSWRRPSSGAAGPCVCTGASGGARPGARCGGWWSSPATSAACLARACGPAGRRGGGWLRGSGGRSRGGAATPPRGRGDPLRLHDPPRSVRGSARGRLRRHRRAGVLALRREPQARDAGRRLAGRPVCRPESRARSAGLDDDLRAVRVGDVARSGRRPRKATNTQLAPLHGARPRRRGVAREQGRQARDPCVAQAAALVKQAVVRGGRRQWTEARGALRTDQPRRGGRGAI